MSWRRAIHIEAIKKIINEKSRYRMSPRSWKSRFGRIVAWSPLGPTFESFSISGRVVLMSLITATREIRVFVVYLLKNHLKNLNTNNLTWGDLVTINRNKNNNQAIKFKSRERNRVALFKRAKESFYFTLSVNSLLLSIALSRNNDLIPLFFIIRLLFGYELLLFHILLIINLIDPATTHGI